MSQEPSVRPALLSSGWARGTGLLISVAFVVVVAALSVAVGSKTIPLHTVWDSIWHYDPGATNQAIIHQLRIPRTILGLTVGAALGVAGAVMQGMTRNPLADPGIFGVQAGAAFAVVIGITAFGVASYTGYAVFAFVGAAVASVAVYAVSAAGGGTTPVKLALAGAVTTAMLNSLITAVILFDAATLDEFRFWVVGSLAGRHASVTVGLAPFLVLGCVLAFAAAPALNTLALGRDLAAALGQNVRRAELLAAGSVVVLAGAATAAAGPIAFVGLTIPHIARAICGPDHKWLLPFAAVLGAILLVAADVLGRVIARPGEVQVGIVTALLGAPVFIALVRRRKVVAL